jgi:hypothetical protein
MSSRFIGVFHALNQRLARLCHTKQTIAQFPKLDVAGSSPVSRSIFSITCTPRQISFCLICLNYPADGSDLRASKSDQSAATASRFLAMEEST